MISLEKKDGDLGSGRFVKINGSSPTYPDGVNLDSTRRKAILNGTYDFAVEMAAYYGVTPSTDLVTRLLDSIKDPTLTDVPGIAYMTGSVAGKTAKLSRNNANCNLLK